MDFELKKLTNENENLSYIKIFDFENTSYEKVMELLVETFDGCVVTKVSDDPGNYYIKPYKSNTKYVLSAVKKMITETNC